MIEIRHKALLAVTEDDHFILRRPVGIKGYYGDPAFDIFRMQQTISRAANSYRNVRIELLQDPDLKKGLPTVEDMLLSAEQHEACVKKYRSILDRFITRNGIRDFSSDEESEHSSVGESPGSEESNIPSCDTPGEESCYRAINNFFIWHERGRDTFEIVLKDYLRVNGMKITASPSFIKIESGEKALPSSIKTEPKNEPGDDTLPNLIKPEPIDETDEDTTPRKKRLPSGALKR